MLAEMTWEQFRAWQEYAELEPFGPQREDYRAGVIASTVVNASPAKKRGARPVKPTDFFPATPTARRRKPLTDPSEWGNVISMAKVIAQAKDDR